MKTAVEIWAYLFCAAPFALYILIGPLPATTRWVNCQCGCPGRWWPLAGAR